PREWDQYFIDFIGPDMMKKLDLEPLDEDLTLSAYDRGLSKEFISYHFELTDEERFKVDEIVKIEGTDIKFLKAIKLSNIFPEMAEDE
ncbi:MAG: hypothetical protein AAGJ85_05015, partial [Pseudomonadota bacterium]